MTIDHAAIPSICGACTAECHERAKSAPGALLKKCAHTGGIVVAVGFVTGGQIVRWDVRGPCSQREAEQLAMAYLSALRPAARRASRVAAMTGHCVVATPRKSARIVA